MDLHPGSAGNPANRLTSAFHPTRTLSESRCWRSATPALAGEQLEIDQQSRRVLDRFLDADEEGDRFAAVDQAVIVA